MKLLVVSDIHGSLFYTKKMVEIMEKEEVDKVILLGDLYYHGPRNPLPKEYNPMEVSKILNSLKEKLICIKGNCDAEVDEMISEFKFNDHVKLEINNKNMMRNIYLENKEHTSHYLWVRKGNFKLLNKIS